MSTIKTQTQVSAGGVVFRKHEGRTEIAIIAVGDPPRWQLPKGIVEAEEPPETTALREVREEAGVETELIGPIHTVEYWYVSTQRGQRVRFHKFVHFYLLRYKAGDVSDHDHEVHDARWVTIDEALDTLTFANERQVVAMARERIEEAEHGD